MDAELRYLYDYSGLPADSPRHQMRKGEEVISGVYTLEIPAMLADGWELISAGNSEKPAVINS